MKSPLNRCRPAKRVQGNLIGQKVTTAVGVTWQCGQKFHGLEVWEVAFILLTNLAIYNNLLKVVICKNKFSCVSIILRVKRPPCNRQIIKGMFITDICITFKWPFQSFNIQKRYRIFFLNYLMVNKFAKHMRKLIRLFPNSKVHEASFWTLKMSMYFTGQIIDRGFVRSFLNTSNCCLGSISQSIFE